MEEILLVNQYQYKFYLNANHAIFINNVLGQVHPHTWEIIIDLLNINKSFVQFNKIEEVINNYLEKYQDKLLNSVEPFDKLNPTLENVVLYFKDKFIEILNEYNLILLSLEISETPSRSYIINLYDEIDIRLLNMNKIQNDEDSFIDQIILANKEEKKTKPKADLIKELKENIQKEPEMEIVVLEKNINIKENDKTTKITSVKHRIKPKQNGLYDKTKNQITIPVKIKRTYKNIINMRKKKRKSY